MSMLPKLKAQVEARKLCKLKSLFTGDETVRTMIVSPEILAIVTPPFPETLQGERLSEFRGWLDAFLEGAEISVAEHPFSKPPWAMLARVQHSTERDFFSIRVTEPQETPGIRAFGAFIKKDKFVVLTWDYREDIENFDAGVDTVVSAWKELDIENPLKGDSIDDYLSNNWSV